MSQLLYKIINPPIRSLLKSPLHSIMSHNTLIIEFKGRKSGKIMSTPVSYQETNGQIHCFTGRPRVWWRNLTSGAPVRLRIKGVWKTAIPEVIKDQSTIQEALKHFLRAVPRDATHAEVKLSSDGEPNDADVRKAAANLVLLRFNFQA